VVRLQYQTDEEKLKEKQDMTTMFAWFVTSIKRIERHGNHGNQPKKLTKRKPTWQQ
jgi:hypothetical protein